MNRPFSRRDFLQQTAGVTAAAAFASSPLSAGRAGHSGHRLGLDNFAVRGMGWKAPRLVDYSASLGCTSLFISDLDAFDSLDDAALTKIRDQAVAKGLQIHLGTWSVCPTSKAFKPNRGTADEHLSLGIRAAKALGSPVIRVVLGTWEDRLTDGGIDRHIESLLAVCRRQRSRAARFRREDRDRESRRRHALDRARAPGRNRRHRLRRRQFDSGNALWTLEDPVDALGKLGRYTLTTSLRDSAVWETPNGAAVAWTAMGEGQIDQESFFTRFDELCPGIAVHIETISGFNREMPYLTSDFWRAWPAMPAPAFARFLAIAKRGTPRAPFQPPQGQERAAAEQAYQRGEIERSIKYCKEVLGLGK